MMDSIIQFYNKNGSSLLSNYPKSNSNTRYGNFRENRKNQLKFAMDSKNSINLLNLSREEGQFAPQFGNLTLSNFPKQKQINRVRVSKHTKHNTFYAKPGKKHQTDSYGIIYEREENKENNIFKQK